MNQWIGKPVIKFYLLKWQHNKQLERIQAYVNAIKMKKTCISKLAATSKINCTTLEDQSLSAESTEGQAYPLTFTPTKPH